MSRSAQVIDEYEFLHEKHVGTREAAAALGVSAKTLRAMIARGDLPAKRIRGRWWIARVDLDEGPEPPG